MNSSIKDTLLNAAKAIVAAAIAAALPLLVDAVNDVAAAVIGMVLAGGAVYATPNKEIG